MAKNYLLQFGSTTWTGLTPSFILFKTFPGGTNVTPPGITEIPTASGLYYFTWGPTNSIAFVVDGGAALTSPVTRYITGDLDPIQAVDEKIGTTEDSFGSTSVDPTTIFGYVKRLQEWNEGNATFNKSSGAWDVYSRGSSVMLAEKELVDAASEVTKS